MPRSSYKTVNLHAEVVEFLDSHLPVVKARYGIRNRDEWVRVSVLLTAVAMFGEGAGESVLARVQKMMDDLERRP